MSSNSSISKEEGDTYCGFLCDDIIEKQQAILDEIKDFSKHNPEFAAEMLNKLRNMLVS